MKNSRTLMGILFIMAGIGLIINKLGYFQDVNVFSLLATAYLAYVVIRSMGKKNIFGILVPLSLMGVIYKDYLGIESFNPWTLVGAAVLISIGISMIFKSTKRHRMDGKFNYKDEKSHKGVDGKIHVESLFAECIRYLQGEDLQEVKLESTFASMKIYFDKLRPKNNHLLVSIEATFSGIELYIPKEWKVINNADVTFGGVNEKSRNTGEDTNTLILQGDVTLAGVDIIYI